MADYTLSYSGEELDEVCEKVKAINPSASDINSFFTNAIAITSFFNHKDKLQMRWGTRVLEEEIPAWKARIREVMFGNIFPEGLENRNDPLILACTDYGDTARDDLVNVKFYYIKNGRDVKCTLKFETEGAAVRYKITVYCLVIYTTDGSQGIE